MNALTSQHRKLIYLGGILLLLIPIILLGRPAGGSAEGQSASGGTLAQLRQEHDLGETSLGNVDPASATMNLVLLGFRGPASTLLSVQLEDQRKKKEWAQMRATTQSIIMLQPHFVQVWRYQGWNLAYNVSAEWDAVADRYFWVKEGGKFLMEGTQRNEKNPELYWEAGRVLGQKVGRADEWREFRKFFLKDPDTETYEGGPDWAFNRGGKDNYLEAKDWYTLANERELEHVQHIMMRMLFRQYPARSQFDYADALQREGIFDEVTQIAWDEAFRDWTDKFGQEIWQSEGGEIRLEATEDDIKALSERDGVPVEVKRRWIDQYQKIANYRYWRTRGLAERETQMVAAHRDIYDGQQLFKQGELREAQQKLEEGMQKYAGMLKRYPTLASENTAMEEGLMAVIYWRYTLLLLGEQPSADFALRDLWNEHQGPLITELDQRFRRENSIQSLE